MWFISKEISARVEDRSTHDKIKDAATTYAGRFFVMLLDTVSRKKFLHERQYFCEHLFLVVITVQNNIMNIRFLRAINPTAERDYWGKYNVPDNWAYEDKQSSLEWARSLSWTDRVNVKRML